jgi:hypothetical protein
MSKFNWDDHPIVKNGSKESFNWDDHPVVESPPQPKAELPQTILEGFGNAGGYLPHLQAGVEMVTDAIGSAKDKVLQTIGLDQLASIDAQLRQKGFKLPESSYVAVRDANIQRQAKQAHDHPLASGGSKLVGNIVSGIATSGLLPAAGASAAGASLAARIGSGVLQGAKAGAAYGALSNPGDTEGEISPVQLADRLDHAEKGALFGSAIGGAIPVGAAVIRPVAEKLSGPAQVAVEKLYAPYRALAQKLSIPVKEAAERIEEAARKLGVKPTPGMIYDNEFIQNLESSLHQAPSSFGGAIVRRGTVPVSKGLAQASEEVLEDASALTKFEAGEQAKKEITEDVTRKFQPSKDTFQDLAQYTKDIKTTPRSVDAVTRNILSIPEVEVLDLPLAKQVAKALEKNPSANQIKILRGIVGKEAEAAEGASAKAYWEIYHKLGRLEQNTIKRGVIQSARTQPEGERIAEGMLGQLKGANKSYSTQIGKVQDVAENARLGRVNNPSQFTNKVEAIRSENVQDKLLNLADSRLTESIKENFPQAYTTLRGAKLGDLARSSQDAEGNFITTKLLSNTKKYSPEGQKALFQNNSDKLDDIRLVHGSLPEKVGQSGTSQAFDIKQFLNPVSQVRDLARAAIYKGLTNNQVQAVAKALSKNPEFKAIAEIDPKAANAVILNFVQKMKTETPATIRKSADDKPKGPEKWASDGFDKLAKHDPTLADFKSELFETKKGRDLLIQASDLQPGSKAMDRLKLSIKSNFEKGQ